MKTVKMLTILAFSLGAAPTALAQGWIEPIRPIQIGPWVTKVRTEVSVSVSGRVATVEVEEWFRNDGPGLGEGDYLYPLPGEAVFSNFSLYQGDQELRGETMDATRAREIYEEIVRSRRDPALIELAGHGLVRARIFPINHGETRKITLRYTQVMNRAGDALQFRYAAGTANRRQIHPLGTMGPLPQQPQGRVPLSFTLTAESGSMFGDPFSPTHEVIVARRDGALHVRPESDLHGDFTLFLPLATDLVGITVATHRQPGEDGYFMLTLSPGTVTGSGLPRDLTVVLDVSGSMSGSKLDQAKRAIEQLLAGLNSSDRFRLIAFSSGITRHSADWSDVNSTTVAEAREWISRLAANGGTNIAGALEEAFRLDSPPDRLPITLFLTDGLPTVGEQDPEAIAAAAERSSGRSRIFSLGVGYDVNTYLLDRLATAGRGSTQYLQPGEDIESAIGTLVAKISHPVLTDLVISDLPVEIDEVYPRQLSDLFAGEEMIIFGRYSDGGASPSGEVTIQGMRNNTTALFATVASFPERNADNDFMPRLWAARKLGWLTRQLRLSGHNEELVEEVRELALRYGLLSEYTSYLVQEPLEMAAAGPGLVTRGREDMRVQLRAVAPQQATGQMAVRTASRDEMRRNLAGESQLVELEEALADEFRTDNQRLVAGRAFRLVDDVWVDVRHDDSTRTVSIAPYSDAYFRLLRLAPELQLYWSEFEQVVVTGHGVSIAVKDEGQSTMSGGELALLVRAFRGL